MSGVPSTNPFRQPTLAPRKPAGPVQPVDPVVERMKGIAREKGAGEADAFAKPSQFDFFSLSKAKRVIEGLGVAPEDMEWVRGYVESRMRSIKDGRLRSPIESQAVVDSEFAVPSNVVRDAMEHVREGRIAHMREHVLKYRSGPRGREELGHEKRTADWMAGETERAEERIATREGFDVARRQSAAEGYGDPTSVRNAQFDLELEVQPRLGTALGRTKPSAEVAGESFNRGLEKSFSPTAQGFHENPALGVVKMVASAAFAPFLQNERTNEFLERIAGQQSRGEFSDPRALGGLAADTLGAAGNQALALMDLGGFGTGAIKRGAQEASERLTADAVLKAMELAAKTPEKEVARLVWNLVPGMPIEVAADIARAAKKGVAEGVVAAEASPVESVAKPMSRKERKAAKAAAQEVPIQPLAEEPPIVAGPRLSEVLKGSAGKIGAKAEDVLAEARRLSEEAGGSVGAGLGALDPKRLQALEKFAQYGAMKVGEGMVEFAAWSAHMVEVAGDWIEPHLKGLWEAFHSDDPDTSVARLLKGESGEVDLRVTAADLQRDIDALGALVAKAGHSEGMYVYPERTFEGFVWKASPNAPDAEIAAQLADKYEKLQAVELKLGQPPVPEKAAAPVEYKGEGLPVKFADDPDVVEMGTREPYSFGKTARDLIEGLEAVLKKRREAGDEPAKSRLKLLWQGFTENSRETLQRLDPELRRQADVYMADRDRLVQEVWSPIEQAIVDEYGDLASLNLRAIRELEELPKLIDTGRFKDMTDRQRRVAKAWEQASRRLRTEATETGLWVDDVVSERAPSFEVGRVIEWESKGVTHRGMIGDLGDEGRRWLEVDTKNGPVRLAYGSPEFKAARVTGAADEYLVGARIAFNVPSGGPAQSGRVAPLVGPKVANLAKGGDWIGDGVAVGTVVDAGPGFVKVKVGAQEFVLPGGSAFKRPQLMLNDAMYFPRQIDRAKLLREFGGLLDGSLDIDDPVFDKVVQYLIQTGQAKGRGKVAIKSARSQVKSYVKWVHKQSGSRLRTPRKQIRLPDEWYVRDFVGAARGHVFGAADEIAQTRMWGDQLGGLAASLERIEREGTANETFEAMNAMKKVLGIKEMEEPWETQVRWLTGVEGSWQLLTKLTSGTTAIAQLSQFVNTFQAVGGRAWWKAAFGNRRVMRELRSDARLSGVTGQRILDLYGGGEVGPILEAVTGAAAKWSGIKPIDEAARVHSAVAHLIATEGAIKALKWEDGRIKRNAAERWMREVVGFSQEEIERIAVDGMARNDVDRVYMASGSNQVRTRDVDVNRWILKLPGGRTFVRFGLYMAGQVKVVGSAFKAARSGDFGPLLRWYVGGSVAGEGIRELRSRLIDMQKGYAEHQVGGFYAGARGEGPEAQERSEKRQRTLEGLKDGELWRLVEHGAANILDIGTFGAWQDLVPGNWVEGGRLQDLERGFVPPIVKDVGKATSDLEEIPAGWRREYEAGAESGGFIGGAWEAGSYAVLELLRRHTVLGSRMINKQDGGRGGAPELPSLEPPVLPPLEPPALPPIGG